MCDGIKFFALDVSKLKDRQIIGKPIFIFIDIKKTQKDIMTNKQQKNYWIAKTKREIRKSNNAFSEIIKKGILLEVLEGHILQQRGMSQDKTAPLFLVNLPVVLCISFLKCLEQMVTKIVWK